jgi:hypothetical protein
MLVAWGQMRIVGVSLLIFWDVMNSDGTRWSRLFFTKKETLIFGNCEVTGIFVVAKVKTLSKLQKSVFKKSIFVVSDFLGI